MIDLYDPKEQWASYVINAIKAKEFQVRDVNYIVRKGEVSLFPPFLDKNRIPPNLASSAGCHLLPILSGSLIVQSGWSVSRRQMQKSSQDRPKRSNACG